MDSRVTRLVNNSSDQSGSVQARVLIGIAAVAALVDVSVGADYVYSSYSKPTNTIDRSGKLSIRENHSDAITLLQPTQETWLVRFLGVKHAEIGETLDGLELRLAHQVTF